MKALRQRNAEAGIAVHSNIAPRVYAGSDVHAKRIEQSRDYVTACLGGRKGCRIIELGCGTLDISGPFSDDNEVWGMDCNESAAGVATMRWPKARLNLCSLQPESCDVLVLCEFLERSEEHTSELQSLR